MTCPCSPRSAPEFDPDSEGPSAADLDRFGGETHTCPDCRAEVYDGASICPHCGGFLDDATLGAGRAKRALFTVGLILAGVAFVLVFVL